MATVSQPAASITSRLTPSLVSLRFAIGDLRFGHVQLPVLELNGHFLTQPLHIADLLAAQAATDGTSMIFGRSVVIDEASRPLMAQPRVHIIWTYPRYYADLSLSPEEYLAQFSSKSRSTLLRKVRKLQAASGGEIDWSTFRSHDDVDAFLREALSLSERTYQHRLFRSGLTEKMRPAMERYADEGR